MRFKEEYEALIDRVTNLPLPAGCRYFFEGIRAPQELRAYGHRLRALSRENFGWAGPEFVRRLGAEIGADRARVQAFVDERQRTYWDAADSIKSLGERDFTRITDKFATIYVAGCLAARYGILPFTEVEVLEALLTCERDHVAFIDQELGVAPARVISAHGAPAAVAKHAAIAGAVVPAATPFDRLRRFINDNSRGGFIDLRTPHRGRPRATPSKGARVYIAEEEFWIPGDRFREVAGGAREAAALKQELVSRRLLVTDKRGNGLSYVVKRIVPDGRRLNFVVLRHKEKKP